jgi:plastocyanin
VAVPAPDHAFDASAASVLPVTTHMFPIPAFHRTGTCRSALPAIVAACLGLAGCGSDSTSPPAETNGRQVAATPALAFTPGTLTVRAGDAVTFAFGGVAHNVFFAPATGAPADIAGNNASVSITRVFATAGTYAYTCHIHPGMTGTIVVQPATVTYVLQAAAGVSLPAAVDHYSDGTSQVDVYMVADTLTLDGAGAYVQRGTFEARIGTTVVARSKWFDRGRYSISGTAFHGDSEYRESFTLDGALEADGSLHFSQDLVGDGATASYEFRRGA